MVWFCQYGTVKSMQQAFPSEKIWHMNYIKMPQMLNLWHSYSTCNLHLMSTYLYSEIEITTIPTVHALLMNLIIEK